MTITQICQIDGCGNASRARGWCSAHYARWKRYGNPLASGRLRRLRPPPAVICDEFAMIPLAGGQFALVDLGDVPLVSRRLWSLNGAGYAMRFRHLMHREILGAGEAERVDHINGDRLDNRRFNLRLCTQGQNNANSRKRKAGTSRFKGVCWNADKGKWQAQITWGRENTYLGRFAVEEDAAFAYRQAAKAMFGEFYNDGEECTR